MTWEHGVRDGTEAVLIPRAVISTGDLEEYWRFHLAHDHQRLYPGTHSEPDPLAHSKELHPNPFPCTITVPGRASRTSDVRVILRCHSASRLLAKIIPRTAAVHHGRSFRHGSQCRQSKPTAQAQDPVHA
jgi:hypothetical protein